MIEDPCLRNTVMKMFLISSIILIFIFCVKLYNEWFKVKNKTNLFDKKFKIIPGNKGYNLSINRIIIVLVVLIIVVTGLTPIIFKDSGCVAGAPVGAPVGAPIGEAKGYLITVVLDDVYTLEQAKTSICNSIPKCGDVNEIVIVSYRLYETETRVGFRGLSDNISQTDVIDSPNIKFVYEEKYVPQEVEIIVMNFKNFEEQIEPNLVEAPTAMPTSAPVTQQSIQEFVGITFPPSVQSDNVFETCVDLQWSDSEGRNCDFYTSQDKCFQYGTDVNNLGTAINSGCETEITQEDCENLKSRIDNNMCTWNPSDELCSPKPISASDACCFCDGGKMELYDAPTSAPVPPTSAPVPAPTEAPTEAPTAAPTSYAESEPVLGIKGVAQFGNASYSDWFTPLYVYNIQDYNPGEGSERFIEQYFFGKIPAPIGQVPKYDPITGLFEGIPNAIVSVEAKDIKVPDGIELRSDPVDGLPGFYYLSIKSTDCGNKFLMLYTQPIPRFGESSTNSYYSKVNEFGNAYNTKDVFACENFDYSCMCESGNWEPNSKRYIGYPPIPPVLYEGCPTVPPSTVEIRSNSDLESIFDETKHPYINNPTYTKSCKLGTDLDRIWLRNISKEQILYENSPNDVDEETIGGTSFDTKIFFGYTRSELENICPEEYTACNEGTNSKCETSLSVILNKWNKLKQLDIDTDTNSLINTMTDLFGVNQDGQPGVENSKELYNLKKCVNKSANEKFIEYSNTCDFMKDYYKYCKVRTDAPNFIDDIRNSDLTGDLNITFGQFIEFIAVFLIEPMCVYNSSQPSRDFWLPFLAKYKKDLYVMFLAQLTNEGEEIDFEGLDFDAYPLSADEFAYRGTDIWAEMQTDCCSEYNPTTQQPTYKPLPPNAEIVCPSSSGEEGVGCVIL